MESIAQQPRNRDFSPGAEVLALASTIPMVALPPPLPDASIAAASRKPRFCPACGDPWKLEWTECLSCGGRTRAMLVELPGSAETRQIHSMLTFYFALLAICAARLIVDQFYSNTTQTTFVIESVTAFFVVVCAAMQWRATAEVFASASSFAWYGIALALSLATVGIATGVTHTLHTVLHLRPPSMSHPFLKSGYGWGMIVLVLAVQPALIEELAFRGIVLGGLKRALGQWEAVVVSAFMFMVLHLAPARFPHTLALGLAAGFLRIRSKSIYPCILMHFSHNFICIALEWAGK